MALQVTRLSARGQIVIPQSIREKLGLREGEQFIVADQEGSIVMKPLSKMEGEVEAELLDMKLAARAWKEIDEGRARKLGRREFIEELSKW